MRRQALEAHRTGLMDGFLPLRYATLDLVSRRRLYAMMRYDVFAAIFGPYPIA